MRWWTYSVRKKKGSPPKPDTNIMDKYRHKAKLKNACKRVFGSCAFSIPALYNPTIIPKKIPTTHIPPSTFFYLIFQVYLSALLRNH